MRSLLWISVLSAALAGCVADGQVGVRATYVAPPPPVAVVSVQAEPAPQPVYEGQAEVVDDAPYVEPTAMVYVNPDVQVIEDYDYPVFFVNGMYWRNDGGVWYSSSWHDRGWATNYNPPVVVSHIERPEGYVHYHANVHATVGQPGYRNTQRVVVNHPSAPPPRNVTPSHPIPTRQVGRTGETHPVENHPVENHPVEAGHGPVVREPAHPAEPSHPYEGGVSKEPVHPAEPTRAPTPTHEPIPTREPAKTGGYPAAQPTHVQAPTKAPAPYKAPPPAPKKKH
jgi:hypothetical protein